MLFRSIYATPSAKVAIAMGLTTPGSDTGMFPNDPQMVLFKGGIRKGQMVYLHKVPKNLFIKHNGREWYSKPEVTEIKPLEVKAIPVDKWLNLIRQATPADLELQKKYMKQGVAEGIHSPGATQYSGKPDAYTFSLVQQKNYDMLSSILARNGMKFTHIDAVTYPGERAYNAPNRKDRKSTRLNSSHIPLSRMPSSA